MAITAPAAVVIGGGPAGLMAAEVLLAGGMTVRPIRNMVNHETMAPADPHSNPC